MRKKSGKILCFAAVLVMTASIMANGYMEKGLEASNMLEATGNYISVQTDQGVREISFEDYVMGAAACQIDIAFHKEALKAQMVIARTNLYKALEEKPDQLLSEPYRTLDELERMGAADAFQEAAEATAGQVLRRGQGLVRIPYHRVSAGKTRDGAEALSGSGYDWLLPVECASDQESPEYLGIEVWEMPKLQQTIQEAWPDSLNTAQELPGQIEITGRDSADYVTQVRVGKIRVNGEAFREALGLSSSCFNLETVDDGMRITTKGLGHGLGLSQFQAEVMAEAGAGYEEILNTFFQNLQLGT